MSSAANQTVVRLKNFKAADLRDQVSGTVNSVAGQIAEGVQHWASKAKGAARTTDGFVRSSPWQAVGAVALAGLAAGFLVSYGARRVRRAARADAGSEVVGG